VKQPHLKCVVLLLSAVPAALCQSPAVPPLRRHAEDAQKPKLQALIITGQNTVSHDWRATTPVLRQILEDTGRFEVRVTEAFRGAGPEVLAPYDVVILNYYDSNQPALRWGKSTEAALLNYVRSGKGIVVWHFSLAAFDGWTEYEKLCVANWRPNHGHHSPQHDYTVSITERERDHPIVSGMKASFLQVHDELYANLQWLPDIVTHVLATAWDDHSLYKPGGKQATPGPGLNQPIMWTTKYGYGRVFVDALGHDVEAMRSPWFAITLARGAEWAASGEVTIPMPQELR